MVNFWATWCAPCRLEMPDLDWIYTHFQSQGLVVLAITDEDAFTGWPVHHQLGYHFPVLIDPDGKVAQAIPRLRHTHEPSSSTATAS